VVPKILPVGIQYYGVERAAGIVIKAEYGEHILCPGAIASWGQLVHPAAISMALKARQLQPQLIVSWK
jgi:hypothetical protein